MSSLGFPLLRPHELPSLKTEQKWLIDDLWGYQAVGIIGGEPKSYKSFLALELGIAVASGKICLGRYPVKKKGPVLLYAAEDALHIVRERLEAMCKSHGLELQKLNFWVVTVPVMRLDHKRDRNQLVHTIEKVKPALLILDPFVRLHRIDENISSEVAPLLAFLRQQQRQQGCAVILVHHARKGGGSMRGGQALRGSSEFHAWGDSNIYLRHTAKGLRMLIEHRAAPSQENIPIDLFTENGAMLVTGSPTAEQPPPTASEPSPHQRVTTQLQKASGPLKTRPLRKLCRMKSATLTNTLNELKAAGIVTHTEDGWILQ